MEMERLENGIEQFGTPLYVFNTDELVNCVKKFREMLGEKVGLCYAMKANPFLTGQMEAIVDKIEVCSMGEFRICRRLGLPPEKILVSGVLKKKEDILEILEYCRGKCSYTAESLNQYQYFADWSDANHEMLQIYPRLTSGNQFGMDKETIQNIIESRHLHPYLNIQGIHYFSGTQKKRIKKVVDELAYLDTFLLELELKTKFRIEKLEYGPGLLVPYFEGQADPRQEDIKTLADAICNMQWKGRIMLEMGRAFVADCGYYLTEVKDIKQNDGINYCIADGGIHQMNYDGQIRGMYRPVFRVSPENNCEDYKEWTVCGALCTTNDVLMQKVPLKDLRIGDVLIFERVGAYSMTEGMALFLSHALPKVALYHNKTGWKLIRKDQPTYKWNMEGI
ncbi:MAG: diaminopimelate decarboxylase family protein [Lachnospiraceae bacterium]